MHTKIVWHILIPTQHKYLIANQYRVDFYALLYSVYFSNIIFFFRWLSIWRPGPILLYIAESKVCSNKITLHIYLVSSVTCKKTVVIGCYWDDIGLLLLYVIFIYVYTYCWNKTFVLLLQKGFCWLKSTSYENRRYVYKSMNSAPINRCHNH